jgi:hypothetical protein
VSLISVIQQLFPQARVTSGYRGPNNALTIANPHSLHAQGSPDDPRAVDIAPIPGMSFQDYVSKLKNSGVQVAQAFDEATHPFPWTTGPNWHIAGGANKPISSGASAMPQSRYPVTINGFDPLAPEPQTMPVPMANSAAPSMSVPAASPVAAKKRGGILGALESVFMPDPGSQWAGALRDGLFNAKESQRNYQESQAKKYLDLELANQKLTDMQRKGEYTVVGNNVFHSLPGSQVGPDGKPYEMISGPSATDDKTKLIDLWNARHAANPQDPTLPLIEGLILGGANTPEAMASKQSNAEKIARIRAGATTGAATIRANAPRN